MDEDCINHLALDIKEKDDASKGNLSDSESDSAKESDSDEEWDEDQDAEIGRLRQEVSELSDSLAQMKQSYEARLKELETRFDEALQKKKPGCDCEERDKIRMRRNAERDRSRSPLPSRARGRGRGGSVNHKYELHMVGGEVTGPDDRRGSTVTEDVPMEMRMYDGQHIEDMEDQMS